MATKDERIDAYIEKAKPFAQPLLKHFRKLVHKAAPEVTETLKWGMPHFEMEGPLCWMASFKEHAAFGFWKAELMQDPDEVFTITEKKAMGQFGRIAKKSELPKDTVILGFIKQGV
ncbi:MAG: DUF1801 domain-containing protein, partial [Planctomycetes bacterium]|nr:DUF1801 domain-containing protein [Planctomycetota bacterium]